MNFILYTKVIRIKKKNEEGKKEHQKESKDERERKSGREGGKKGSLALQYEVCFGVFFY